MLSSEDFGASEDESEAVQVLTIKGNRIYLSSEVRAAFDLRNGDKVVVYNASGKMSVKIIRRPRANRPFGQARRVQEAP
jgi:bifunctional DNA-binding transcriptional regulator/antitoxin component of YhaV-PrlF toxin-antitoxin module